MYNQSDLLLLLAARLPVRAELPAPPARFYCQSSPGTGLLHRLQARQGFHSRLSGCHRCAALQAKGGVPLVALKGADQVVSHIEGISRWCDGLHAEIAVGGKDQFLEAIIEDLQEHIAKTMYLLTLQ